MGTAPFAVLAAHLGAGDRLPGVADALFGPVPGGAAVVRLPVPLPLRLELVPGPAPVLGPVGHLPAEAVARLPVLPALLGVRAPPLLPPAAVLRQRLVPGGEAGGARRARAVDHGLLAADRVGVRLGLGDRPLLDADLLAHDRPLLELDPLLADRHPDRLALGADGRVAGAG